MLLLEHFRTARESLRRTRVRTLLTISGVAIGVASITTILALGSGVTNIINRQVTELGSSIAVVRPTTKETSLLDFGNPLPPTSYTTSPLKERDVLSIEELDEVRAAVPLMTLSGSVRTPEQQAKNALILATTPDFPATTKLTFDEGDFISEVTLENTAVIGSQLAVELFGTNSASGKRFTISGQPFTVVGVLKRQNTPINYNNVDLDRTAIISLDSGKLFNGGVAQIQQINVQAKKGTDMAQLSTKISQQLQRNHDNQRDTEVFVGKAIAAPSSKLFSLINTVMAAIASISLLVGGIGIMNIMLVGVAERTHEIGLRKAVGASNRSIVLQFIIEAIIIGLVGGAVGFVGGYVVAFFVSLLLPYDPSLSWSIAGLAAALSAGVGVLFGLYPAIRAARKDPIESLRRMH